MKSVVLKQIPITLGRRIRRDRKCWSQSSIQFKAHATLNADQRQLHDIWEGLASKIVNVFSESVFFSNLQMRDWNLPELIRYGMLKSGGEFYSQMRFFFTLMAMIVFSGISMTRISHSGLSQRITMKEAQSWNRMHSRTWELWSCKLCRGVKTQLDTSACSNDHRSSLKWVVFVKKTEFFNRIMMQFSLLIGQIIFPG